MKRDDDPDRLTPQAAKTSPRRRFIVARNDQALYDYLHAQFAGHPEVEVIMDRREKRSGRATKADKDERRSRSKIDDDLASLGYAVIPIE